MKKASLGITASSAVLLVLLIVISINITFFKDVSADPGCTDNDGDYFTAEITPDNSCCGPSGNEVCYGGSDCNDTNIQIYPGALEICDSQDGDCDGYIDEYNDPSSGIRYVGQSCYGIGECGGGKVECKAGVNVVDCWTNPGGSHDQSEEEVCDSKDNNCDGVNDDTFFYYDVFYNENRYVGQSCYGIGECGGGKVECFNLFTCSCWTNPGGSYQQNSTEICNGLDDDCNGETDEDGVCDMISITLGDHFPIGFGAGGGGELNPGTQDNPANWNSGGGYTITVDSETTMNVDLYHKADDFTIDGNGNTIGVRNMSWSLTNDPGTSMPMNSTYESGYPIATDVESGTDIVVYYWLDLPTGKSPGNYETDVSVKAVETGIMP